MTEAERRRAAKEYRARQDAERAANNKRWEHQRRYLQGDMQAITGRLQMPGELPGIAPQGTASDVLDADVGEQLLQRSNPFTGDS
jgi:hypothetical protein